MSEDYLPIRLSTISIDTVLDFDLYQEVSGNMRLYRDKNLPVTQSDIDKLLESGHEYLYVAGDQKHLLFEHMCSSLPAILADDSIPLESKIKTLSEASVIILSSVLRNPMAPGEIKMVVKQCENHVLLAMQGSNARQKMAGFRPEAPFAIAHAISVGNLSLLLGLRCGVVEQKELHGLGIGALLHEIGKTIIDRDYYYLPDSTMLQKNSRFKNYPTIGKDLIEKTKGVPPSALRPVLEHRERLDGSGFPQSLRAENISKVGRIVAICDAYDEAVHAQKNSGRVRPFDILSRMKQSAGKFDSKILSQFILLLGSVSAEETSTTSSVSRS